MAKVLVVDDSNSIRDMVSFTLKGAGYDVTEARDGMGNDGAKSMKEMYDVGAKTIAQDEKSSVVFGMPKEAIAMGGVHHIVSLEQIAHKLMALVK